MSDENNLLDHNYDGIQEYDNPLPNWWLVTFYATIIFGFLYWVHYEFGGAATQAKELAVAMEEIEKAKASSDSSAVAEAPHGGPATPDELKEGRVVYAQKCGPCHGDQGQGVIGPNLTDNFWINGKGTEAEIRKVVAKGVGDKGMPAWEALLSREELQDVVLYVVSLKGSNPPNPKAPQGTEVK